MLHRDLFYSDPAKYTVLPRFQRPSRTDPFEQEANVFAANLLVPSHLLRTVRHAPVAQLASIFGVSRQMMENRLKHA
jgi:Zn-dependent peptidase ImmA (M78 family)